MPLEKNKIPCDCLHVDMKTVVKGYAFFGKSEITLNWKHHGMDYSRNIDMLEAIKMGLIECDCSCVRPILGFENYVIAEECTVCGKEILQSQPKTTQYKVIAQYPSSSYEIGDIITPNTDNAPYTDVYYDSFPHLFEKYNS